ncbi:MAG: outer membrane protein [Xanthobacteraceae bacterium]
MKRMLIAGVFVFTAAGQALAADMPAPFPSPQPPASYYPAAAPFNWSGIYVGANGGYGFGTSSWNAPAVVSATSPPSPAVATGTFNLRGLLAGGTVGLNLQADAFVFGIEADGDWTNLKGNGSSANYCTAGVTCETKSPFFGTLRARFGYAFNRVLVYGTGGLADAKVQAGFSPPATFDGADNFGWTGGAGIEFAFADNWTAKVEYLYAALGTMTCSTAANCGNSVPVTVSLTENIVRAGINYKFGPW